MTGDKKSALTFWIDCTLGQKPSTFALDFGTLDVLKNDEIQIIKKIHPVYFKKGQF